MSHSTRITSAEILGVMRLLAEVTARKSHASLQHQVLVDGLNELVGTNQGFFFFTRGWRAGQKPQFTYQTLTAQHDPVFLSYAADFGVNRPLEADPFCDVSIRDPARLQVLTFDRVLPDRNSERKYSAFMDIRRGGRVNDGIVCLHRMPDDLTVGVGLHQFGAAPALKARSRTLVRFAVAEIHRLVQLGHIAPPPSDPAAKKLPPRLQKVLDLMLAGKAPKRIAVELGISLWTVREYIAELYKISGVSSREELMARWIAPQ